MPIKGWDHLELYVGNAKQAAYFYERAFGLHAHRLRGARDGHARPRFVRPRPERHPARAHERPSPGQRDHPLRVLTRRRREGRRARGAERDRGVPAGGPARCRGASSSRTGWRTTSAASSSRRSRRTARTSTRSSTATTTQARISRATRRRPRTARPRPASACRTSTTSSATSSSAGWSTGSSSTSARSG